MTEPFGHNDLIAGRWMPAQLARLLGKFEILSGTIRLPDGRTPKGYYLSAFKDAFAAYLPSESATPPQPNNDGHCGAFQSATPDKPVALLKVPQTNNDGHCGAVALSKGGEGQKGEQSGVPMRSDAPGLARPEAANGQALRPPTPRADATASLDAPVEETAPSPSLVSDPASDPPKETAASSPTLASPDLDDIPALRKTYGRRLPGRRRQCSVAAPRKCGWSAGISRPTKVWLVRRHPAWSAHRASPREPPLRNAASPAAIKSGASFNFPAIYLFRIRC